MNLRQAYAHFYNHLSVNEQKSINTIKSYQIDLNHYLTYLHDNKIKEIEDVTYQVIDDYLLAISKYYKANTINHKITTIKQFHLFLSNFYHIPNPTLNLESTKPGKKLPKFLSEQDTKRFFEDFPATDEGIYQKTIFELLYGCGLRVSELCSLTINNLHLTQGFIKVVGKGNKERFLPLNKHTIDTIETYLPIRQKFNKYQLNFLMINHLGHQLQRQAINKILKKRLLELNLNPNITPHCLRHTYATHLLNNGADLKSVQELLGHEDLTTTQIYTHTDVRHIQELYQKLMKK